MSIKSTIVIQKEEDWYVATSIESGVASQGKMIDESIANLKEVLELYYIIPKWQRVLSKVCSQWHI